MANSHELAEHSIKKEKKHKKKEKKERKEKKKHEAKRTSAVDSHAWPATPPRTSSPKDLLHGSEDELESQNAPRHSLDKLDTEGETFERELETILKTQDGKITPESLVALGNEQSGDLMGQLYDAAALSAERKEKKRKKEKKKRKKKDKGEGNAIDLVVTREDKSPEQIGLERETPIVSQETDTGSSYVIASIGDKIRNDWQRGDRLDSATSSTREEKKSKKHKKHKKRKNVEPSPEPSDTGILTHIMVRDMADIPTGSPEEVEIEAQGDATPAPESPIDTSSLIINGTVFDTYYPSDSDEEQTQQQDYEGTTEVDQDSDHEEPAGEESEADDSIEASEAKPKAQVKPSLPKRKRHPSPSTERVSTKRLQKNDSRAKPSLHTDGKLAKSLNKSKSTLEATKGGSVDDSDSDSDESIIGENALTFKKPPPGLFSPIEVENLMKFRNSYCKEHGVSHRDFNFKIHANARTDRKLGILWTEIQECVLGPASNQTPRQRRQAVMKACRRIFHNYTKRGQWTKEEDRELAVLARKHGNAWSRIAEDMERMPEDVRDRWRNHTKVMATRTRSRWTREDVKALKRAVGDCAAATYESRRRGEEEQGGLKRKESKKRNEAGAGAEKKTDADIEDLVIWGVVSDKLGGKRDRLQCASKWKALKEIPKFDVGAVLARGLKRLKKKRKEEGDDSEEEEEEEEEDDIVDETEPETDINEDERSEQEEEMMETEQKGKHGRREGVIKEKAREESSEEEDEISEAESDA